MVALLVTNVIIKLGFIAAAVYLLTHGHPTAGAWCIFGAFFVDYSYGKEDK